MIHHRLFQSITTYKSLSSHKYILQLTIKVYPSSSETLIKEIGNSSIVINIKQEREGNKANNELIKYVNTLFPQYDFKIIKGKSSQKKIIESYIPTYDSNSFSEYDSNMSHNDYEVVLRKELEMFLNSIYQRMNI